MTFKIVTDKLHEMPAWADILIDDADNLFALALAVKHLCATSPEQNMRYGIQSFIQECHATNQGFNVSAMSKLFVLNRCFFDIP
ncbi:MAG: hypothetical protein AAGE59_30515, partial [Cyanobacteria bacterium P01_F01_bin.86]